jgi:hypothetical protein
MNEILFVILLWKHLSAVQIWDFSMLYFLSLIFKSLGIVILLLSLDPACPQYNCPLLHVARDFASLSQTAVIL